MYKVRTCLPMPLYKLATNGFHDAVAAQYGDGNLRLVGGSYQWEGRVEVFFNRSWGTITDSNWTSEDAQAVCRTLGYFRPGKAWAAFGGSHRLFSLSWYVRIIAIEKTAWAMFS